MHRFITDSITRDGFVTLSAQETHHLMDVLRHRPGDEVEVLDGKGSRFRARLLRREGAGAVLEALPDAGYGLSVRRCAVPDIALYQAILKGKRMDVLVEKAVELGARRIVPMVTRRTIVRVDRGLVQKQRRWLRKGESALKQCGRPQGVEIAQPITFAEFLSQVEGYELVCLAALSEDSRPLAEVLRENRGVGSLAFAIGPEGDFTGDELGAARDAGCRLVWLGGHVLRGETAAIAALAGALYEWSATP